ncbi:RNA polymerase sigma factor [Prauserella muralis]|uniref:Uncharacterized protein n=1 Tax=Prauserella muralis TaxID=588067 RepID=A0A2V4B061_9PSEU|nr:DUF6596 domain-containing protein [Prauserella muralis]PXY27383.1 hypothetical protein BAY60_13165 [Prauserella muralis]TWE22928.1 RNA polymerase sigma-70 factor (ECF subfamily) [Prauserella muralis]
MTDDSEAGPGLPTEPPTDDGERLRLLLTCCHPALTRDARVALTLRLLCGLSTPEVAHVLLVPEPVLAARIADATRWTGTAAMPLPMPPEAELPEHVGAATEVLHHVFTTGHVAPAGDTLIREDLVDSAIDLTRLLHRLLPRQGEVTGLLALMLLTDARREARLSPTGEVVSLAEQDRSRWDGRRIAEGMALLAESLRQNPTGYAVQAGIAAVHAEAASWEDTDWAEIAALYDVLHGLSPSPVVELNRAVAIGFRDGPQAGLAALAPLLDAPALATYPYLSAARADFLRRLGRRDEAATAYEEALAMTGNEVERAFLARRLDEVRPHPR